MVEVQFEPIEGQEYPDIRDRYDKNDRQRLFQGIKQDTGRKENNNDDQKHINNTTNSIEDNRKDE